MDADDHGDNQTGKPGHARVQWSHPNGALGGSSSGLRPGRGRAAAGRLTRWPGAGPTVAGEQAEAGSAAQWVIPPYRLTNKEPDRRTTEPASRLRALPWCAVAGSKGVH